MRDKYYQLYYITYNIYYIIYNIYIYNNLIFGPYLFTGLISIGC